MPCWTCRYCLRGQYWMCGPHDIYGFKRRTPGAMAEYMVYPAEALVHTDQRTLPPAHAAFAEPFSCSLHAVERATSHSTTSSSSRAAVRSGSGMVAGARPRTRPTSSPSTWPRTSWSWPSDCGADVDRSTSPTEDAVGVVKRHDRRLRRRRLPRGHRTPIRSRSGLNLLRKLGTYVEYSVFGSDVSVDWSIISDDKELDVRGAHLGPDCWPAAIRMIESGRLPMDRICTHQLPLADFQKGLDMVGERQGVDQGLADSVGRRACVKSRMSSHDLAAESPLVGRHQLEDE